MTPRTLVSCVGEVKVARPYGYCGRCRRGVAGLDRWAGLSRDTLTPKGRRMAVLAGSRMSFDEASAHLRELCGIRISDQTIRRACDGAGRRAQAYLRDSPQAAAPVREAPGHAECSSDGAKVNTVEGWREIRAVLCCKRAAGEPAGVRRWKGRRLEEPRAKLAWAGIRDSDQTGEVMASMRDRLGWTRGQGVSVIGDGIPWLWTQARRHLPAHEGVLDIFHVMEHFHAAARALHGQGDRARRWAELQRAGLFRYGAPRYLQERLLPQARAAHRAEPGGEKAEALRSLLLYLWRHRGRLGYRDRLRRGLPIGSGQIEGLCKNTLNRRLRKNSPRWRPERADHMAALCCLHASGQWDRFWSHAG